MLRRTACATYRRWLSLCYADSMCVLSMHASPNQVSSGLVQQSTP